jgi:hypothetical protein
LLNDTILIESWTVIKFAHPARGEANMGHIGDHTATELGFLA